MKPIVALFPVLLVMQGCAAFPAAVAAGAMGAIPASGDVDARRAAQPAPLAGLSALDGMPALGALPAQTLPSGECALFLFTRSEPSQFTAFALAEGDVLTLSLDGQVTALPAAAGFVTADDTFQQTYRADNGMEARLTATFGESLPQGRRAPEAALRLVAPDGAAQVTPLAGLLACEAE